MGSKKEEHRHFPFITSSKNVPNVHRDSGNSSEIGFPDHPSNSHAYILSQLSSGDINMEQLVKAFLVKQTSLAQLGVLAANRRNFRTVFDHNGLYFAFPQFSLIII